MTFAVVGGGLAGLAAARVLAGLVPVSTGAGPSPRSPKVSLFEAAEDFGGKVATGSLLGVPVELGPDQFLRRDQSAERLARHLGLGDKLVAPKGTTAGLFAHSVMRQLPPGLVLGVPTDLEGVARSGIISDVGLERARRDRRLDGPLLTATEVGLEEGPEGGELSAGQILRPRLGDEVVDYLVDPLLGGINAGSVDDLSLGVTAPRLAESLVGHRDVIEPLSALPAAPATAGPAFFGLEGGLGQLVTAAVTELRSAGVELLAGRPVLQLESRRDGGYLVVTASGSFPCDGVVLATPAAVTAKLLEGCAPRAAAELAGIAYADVALLTLAYPVGSLELPQGWTGLLVPRKEGRLMTAASWLTSKWPWMASRSHELVRLSAGRYGESRAAELDDDELAGHLLSELGEMADIWAEPAGRLVRRWPQSFPQYRPGHRGRIRRAVAGLEHLPGLVLAGALLGGIGMPACISSGEAAASRLLGLTRR